MVTDNTYFTSSVRLSEEDIKWVRAQKFNDHTFNFSEWVRQKIRDVNTPQKG